MALIETDLQHIRPGDLTLEGATAPMKQFLQDMAADRSSFFDLPAKSAWEEEIHQNQTLLAQRIPEVDTFLHLGIGGSSLGAETIVNALGSPKAPKFHFLDNIDPDYLMSVLQRSDPARALVYVVSKSGGTMETMAQLTVIRAWLEKKLGPDRARNNLVFCTDPEKGALRELARRWSVPCFSIPPNLGGRFSVLSGVGLFPALVAGVDCKQLLKGAADYRTKFLDEASRSLLPPVAELALRLVQHHQKNGRNVTVLMPYSQKLKTLSSWFTQLWAESLGKGGHGMTPVASVGATDQHSILQLLRDGPQDKVVGFIEVAGFQNMLDLRWTGPDLPSFDEITGITMNQLIDAELNATRNVLVQGERPCFTIRMSKLNANTLGQIFFLLETLTGLAGYYLGVDPFDQPGVEEGKILTREYIRACKNSLMS